MEQLLSKKLKIGTGVTSTTYKVQNTITKKGLLCLKVLNEAFFKPEEEQVFNMEEEDDVDFEVEEETNIDMSKVQKLYSEYEILNKLMHPNIITAYAFYFGDAHNNPAILLEYCSYSLDQVLKQLSDIHLVGIIFEICLAMNYIHKNKIIHRDLKLTNILITKKMHVKICDFGVSKVFDLSTMSSISHGVGTFAFMAPEMIDENSKYDEKVDVYSFGIIMYLIITKQDKPPFRIGSYEKFELPDSINQLSRSIIRGCWLSSSKARPSFSDILKLIVDNNFMLINGIESQLPKLREHLGIKAFV